MRRKASHEGTKNNETNTKVEKIVTNGTAIDSKMNKKKEKKIKFQMFLKKLEENVHLKPRQQEYADTIKNNTITFASGQAGTSKSFSACYTLLKLLFEERIEKIIFTKPIKESGENLGFLPGSVDEKLAPYVESFLYCCKEMLGEGFIDYLLENKYIELRPLAYMRGCTFHKCGMFLDESQNSTASQLMLYMTRIGEGSKMIIAGDISQSDIAQKDVALLDFINLYRDLNGIGIFEFTKADIVRHPLLVAITERYEDWKANKGIK